MTVYYKKFLSFQLHLIRVIKFKLPKKKHFLFGKCFFLCLCPQDTTRCGYANDVLPLAKTMLRLRRKYKTRNRPLSYFAISYFRIIFSTCFYIFNNPAIQSFGLSKGCDYSLKLAYHPINRVIVVGTELMHTFKYVKTHIFGFFGIIFF